MKLTNNKVLTKLEQFWSAVGVFIFRIEGTPVDYRPLPAKNIKSSQEESLKQSVAPYNHNKEVEYSVYQQVINH